MPRSCSTSSSLVVEALDPGAERVEEGVRRLEEVDGVRAVVHRHDEPRPERAHDRGGGLTADGRAAADRQEEHVDLADRLLLLGAQRGLAEVAEVAEPKPVEA